MTDWHKWVRGVVKEIAENGSFHVWLIDYGVPTLSMPSKILKLPPMYARMNGRFPRVHLGGLSNCVPIESKYDVDKDCMVSFEPQTWTPSAITIAQDVICRAVQLKFEDYKEMKLPNGPHMFGCLKIQKPDGSWTNLTDCLAKAMVAKITTDNWLNHVTNLDTIKQKEWMTVDGFPLQVSPTTVQPANKKNPANPITGPAICPPVKNENQVAAKEQVNDHKIVEDNQNFQDNKNGANRSVRLHPRSSSINRNIRGVPRDQYTRGMNFNDHRIWRGDRKDFSSGFPHGWHGNGKLNNRGYREEVEHFESGFRKTTKPVTKVEASSDDSADEKNKNEMTEKNGTLSTTEAINRGGHENNDQNVSVDEAATKNQNKPAEVKLPSNGGVSDEHGEVEGTKPNVETDQPIVDASNAVNVTAMAQNSNHNENLDNSKDEKFKVTANIDEMKVAL